MSVEKAVRTIVTGDATVSGLISSRMYPTRRPQGTALPAIAYTKASQEESDSVDRQAGATRVRMSLDNMAATYGGVKSLATAVRDALINYSGTAEGVTINSIRETMHADLGENLEPGGDGAVYRVITDFIIWHE